MTTVNMEVGNDGVAVIIFSNPPVNALSLPIIDGLKMKFNEAMRRNDVKAVVVTGKGGRFSGGFDINNFVKVHKTGDVSILPDVSVELMVNTIEDAMKPVVAAIEGLALGGGLELAMACHARITVPKVQLGLPELTLGVIPGFGGTQRLPRLVGVKKAVQIMLVALSSDQVAKKLKVALSLESSKPITSEEGMKLGLVDALVSSQELLKVSRLWALDIVERRKPWVRCLHSTDKTGSFSEAREILKIARENAKKTAPNLPQHQACIDVIEHGILYGGYSGVLKEAEVFKNLVLTDSAKGLVHMFLSQRGTSKVPNVTDNGLKPRPIKKVAVIGGGLMGSGISTALILSNIYVVLKEVNSEYLLRGIKMVEANIRGLVTRKKVAEDKADTALSMIQGSLDYSEFKDVDMVIEAVIENIPLKQTIFSEIEKICPPRCILASNTSSIDLNVVGAKTSSQDRIVGAHFFSPAHLMPLLEIVRTEKTSAQVILDLMTVGKIMKKVPVVVGNCTGFAVNRTFFPYRQGSNMLLNLGVDVFRIDRVIVRFGLPLGPFQLHDLGGYGLSLAVEEEFASAFPDRTLRSPLVELLLKNGRNGYYTHEKGSKPKPDLSVLPIIEECRRITNLMPGGKPINVTDQEIVEMILFPVVNEACRVIEEGVVARASDLDVASVLGMSFPSYRGGIVFWADTIGAKYIYTSLKKWSERYGNFYKPSRFLEERAAEGIPLSAPTASTSPTFNSKL